MATFDQSREYKDVPMLFRDLDCDPADQDVFTWKWWLVQIKHWYLSVLDWGNCAYTTPGGHHLFREVWSLRGGNTRSTNIYHYSNTVKTIRCSTMITPQNHSHFTNIGYLSALFLSTFNLSIFCWKGSDSDNIGIFPDNPPFQQTVPRGHSELIHFEIFTFLSIPQTNFAVRVH